MPSTKMYFHYPTLFFGFFKAIFYTPAISTYNQKMQIGSVYLTTSLQTVP